jgi:hypothetical protein
MNGYFATPRGAHPIGSVLNLFAGIWLCISPHIMGFTHLYQALWNGLLVGVAVILLSVVRLSNSARLQALSWINVLLGAWLIVAPFALRYDSVALPRWNDIILGIIVGLLGLWAALTPQSMARAPITNNQVSK